MRTAEYTVANYVAAWQEPDAATRAELLEACWTEDGVYSDPRATLAGRAALADHIGDFHRRWSGSRLELVSGIDEHDGYLRFGWRLMDPEGDVAMVGVDFGELDDDGRLRRIVGFFGPLPPAPDPA